MTLDPRWRTLYSLVFLASCFVLFFRVETYSLNKIKGVYKLQCIHTGNNFWSTPQPSQNILAKEIPTNKAKTVSYLITRSLFQFLQLWNKPVYSFDKCEKFKRWEIDLCFNSFHKNKTIHNRVLMFPEKTKNTQRKSDEMCGTMSSRK
jgi:hypothetical protein